MRCLRRVGRRSGIGRKTVGAAPGELRSRADDLGDRDVHVGQQIVWCPAALRNVADEERPHARRPACRGRGLGQLAPDAGGVVVLDSQNRAASLPGKRSTAFVSIGNA